MENNEILPAIADELGLTVPDSGHALNKQLLIDRINELIEKGFHQLVTILYRMDVSEARLRQLLEENKDRDAGAIITDLMIERQEQKIKSRQQFSQRDNDIDENEKW